ncbi:DUF2637 domain-containing protein [Actinopolymorpha sp. NPDC004070]|uniref:DUF2637 domain-containing protein n=1 Tax=Actinopolymorpha sp. NPDC004070 TaxID=3154548 RepID=UPI0033A83DA0
MRAPMTKAVPDFPDRVCGEPMRAAQALTLVRSESRAAAGKRPVPNWTGRVALDGRPTDRAELAPTSDRGGRAREYGRTAGAVVRAVPFAVVVASPVVASWYGLTALGRDWLGLGQAAPLVPLTLDAAALYAAVLAWRATLAGDAGGVDRLLVWVYAALSAGLNIWHADSIGGLPAAVFYGAASLSAALVWERTLRAVRRRELRTLGAIDSPAPRYRALRWLLHFTETWGAWTYAIGEGISDAREAMTAHRARTETDRAELDAGTVPTEQPGRTGSPSSGPRDRIAHRHRQPEPARKEHADLDPARTATKEADRPAPPEPDRSVDDQTDADLVRALRELDAEAGRTVGKHTATKRLGIGSSRFERIRRLVDESDRTENNDRSDGPGRAEVR